MQFNIDPPKVTPLISETCPNRYMLKSQLVVAKNLVTTDKASTFDHSASNVLDTKNIIKARDIDIAVWLFIIPINIQNSDIINYIGILDNPTSKI